MENLEQRFQSGGGVYQKLNVKHSKLNQSGGGKLSPRSENWKKKYLEMKNERDNLKQENSTLKNRIRKLKKNKK